MRTPLRESKLIFTIKGLAENVNLILNTLAQEDFGDTTQERTNKLTHAFRKCFIKEKIVLTPALYEEFDEEKEIIFSRNTETMHLIRFAFKNAIYQTYIAPIIDFFLLSQRLNENQSFAIQQLAATLKETAHSYLLFKLCFLPQTPPNPTMRPSLNFLDYETYFKKINSIVSTDKKLKNAIKILSDCIAKIPFELNVHFLMAIKRNPKNYKAVMKELTQYFYFDTQNKKTCQQLFFHFLFNSLKENKLAIKDHALLVLECIENEIPFHVKTKAIENIQAIIQQTKKEPDHAIDNVMKVIDIAKKASQYTGFLNLAKPSQTHTSFYFVIRMACLAHKVEYSKTLQSRDRKGAD